MGSAAALDFKSCPDWCILVAPRPIAYYIVVQRIVNRSSTVRFCDTPPKVPPLFSYFPGGTGDV